MFEKTVTALLAVVVSMPPFGQGASTGDQQRFRHRVGDWHSTAVWKASILGPAGTFSSTEHSEMMGDLILVTHAVGSWTGGPNVKAKSERTRGAIQELTILRYDPAKKVFEFDGFNNSGEHNTATEIVRGDAWIGTGGFQMGNVKVSTRFTLKETSAASYVYKFEISTDGGVTWTQIMDGQATKIR